MSKAQPPRAQLSVGTDTPEGAVIGWMPVWCAEHHFENREKGIGICPHGCPPGPSVRTLWSPAFETLAGGARGGMKTETGRGWLLKGNIRSSLSDVSSWGLSEPTEHIPGVTGPKPEGHHWVGHGAERYCALCVNATYVAHPRYRALVLRENEKDLADWIYRAKLLYEPMGAEVTEKPARVKWPSKAAFILGHMKDESSYTDYMGQEFQRMLFEELTHVPDELRYLRIIGSCRSTFTCRKKCDRGRCRCGVLRRQVLATSNPGNAGHAWVKKRFISIAPPNTLYKDRLSKQTRIYIPSLVTDNPYLMQDAGYIAWLEGLPEPTRSAWRFGDWDSLGGTFFGLFRPKGPLAGEPPEARHVLNSGEYPLQPWWPRWLGGDWGYKHHFAFYWACQAPNGQIIVYRELTGNEMSSRELGSMVARASFPDLEGLSQNQIDPVMTLWLSPDAFGKRDEELTIAESFVRGVEKILGPNSAHFPEAWYRIQTDQPDWEGNFFTQIKIQRKFGLAIRRAQNARIPGWQYLRELMRFRQVLEVDPAKYDHVYACKLLADDPRRYKLYLDSFEARKPEALPKLLIFGDKCPKIVDALPTFVYKEGTEDVLKTETDADDQGDGLRYTLHSHNIEKNREPQKSFVERHLDQVREREPNIDFNSLVWAARKAEEDYKEQDPPKAFHFPLECSRDFRRSKRVN